jgi:uncharacterized protein (DUF362 family)
VKTTHPPACPRANRALTRRGFLQGAGLALAGLALAASPVPPGLAQVNTKSYLPQIGRFGPPSQVAIARAASYERVLVKQQVQAVLDGIGGISELAYGKKVAIKVNLTGGINADPLPGWLETETYLTHPEVVRALLELLSDAGASDVAIVEAAYEPESWIKYGYANIYQATGARVVDLTECGSPYSTGVTQIFSSTSPYYYEEFTVHPILSEIDTLISVSKMKCHNIAGVTHSIKNLFGLVPYRFYNQNTGQAWRSDFHGQVDPGARIPGVIIDLHSARPVNLALIDGIMSMEGGEGSWNTGVQAIQPGLLIAGKDPVAADSVATACMGFDPAAERPNAPFLNGVNHLAMAARRGMGTNNLAQIQVTGEQIADVWLPFQPSV